MKLMSEADAISALENMRCEGVNDRQIAQVCRLLATDVLCDFLSDEGHDGLVKAYRELESILRSD